MTTRNYTKDFKNNVDVAFEKEEIVIELLHLLKPDRKFYSEHNNENAYHLGDIISDKGKYYEVKDDGRIHDTGNVFVESVKRWRSGKVTDGWIKTEKPDYLCVLDEIGCNLYILNYEKLKEIYKQYRFVNTNMGDNITGGFCVPLTACRKRGVLVCETKYYYDEDWDCYEIAELASA